MGAVAGKRDRNRERQRLETFLRSHGGIAYLDVPVSGKLLGWPSNRRIQKVDAVVIYTGGEPQCVDWNDGMHDEFAEQLRVHPTAIVNLHGYSDRTVFGALIAWRELLSRAYPDHRLLSCVAMSDKPCGRDIAYHAAGIEVRFRPGVEAWPTGPIRPYQSVKRQTLSLEDKLVDRYYRETCEGQGTMWQEVPVSDAALDGLRVPDLAGGSNWWTRTESLDELRSILRDHVVEIIEAKARINTDVIGQVIAGASLVAHAFPRHRLIRQTIVVGGPPEPALDWVCNKRGIRVVRYDDV
jgi:hypothetical protein